MPHRKIVLLAVILLVSAVGSWAQSPPNQATTQIVNASHNLGVVVQSAVYDPVKHEITLRLYNSTKQDVTAYNFSVRIDYADGTTRLEDGSTELPVDQAGLKLLFLADSQREEILPEPPTTKEVKRVVVAVDVVVYADRSAEVLNEEAFNRLVERRKASALALQKVSDVMKQALSADNPGQAALNELRRLRKDYGPNGSNTKLGLVDAMMATELSHAIDNLAHGGPPTPDELREYIKLHDERLAATNLHKELTRMN